MTWNPQKMDISMCVYKGKLKEALTMITSMPDDKKIEAVECWNELASELQLIVNKVQQGNNVPIGVSNEGHQINSSNQQNLYATCITNSNRQCNTIAPILVMCQGSGIKQETRDTTTIMKADQISQYHHQDNHVDKSLFDCSYMAPSAVPVIDDCKTQVGDLLDDRLTGINPVNTTTTYVSTRPNLTCSNVDPNSTLFILPSYEPTSSLSNGEQQDNYISSIPDNRPVIKTTIDDLIPQQVTPTSDPILTNEITADLFCPQIPVPESNSSAHMVKYINVNNNNNSDLPTIPVPKVEVSTDDTNYNILINEADEIGNGQYDRGPKFFHQTGTFQQYDQQGSILSMPDPIVTSKGEHFTHTERPLQEIQPYGANYYRPYVAIPTKVQYKYFFCSACNKSFDNADEYETHKQETHLTSCDPILTPLETMNSEDIVKVDVIKKELIRATNSESPEVAQFTTSTVSSNISNDNAINNNNNGNQHRCEVCGKSGFSTKGNLKRHLKAHSGEKPFKCEYCDSCFTEKKSLKIHVRRHTGEKPYKCEICGKLFSQTGVLQSHMALHYNERKFDCNQCGKAFRQRSQLKLHIMRHDGVKRLECSICKHKFLTKGDLERHYRIHTGERPYACKICNKTFTRQQSLNEHMNRHIGSFPYSCKHCDRTFSEMSACYKHAKTHKKEQSSTQVHMKQQQQVL